MTSVETMAVLGFGMATLSGLETRRPSDTSYLVSVLPVRFVNRHAMTTAAAAAAVGASPATASVSPAPHCPCPEMHSLALAALPNWASPPTTPHHSRRAIGAACTPSSASDPDVPLPGAQCASLSPRRDSTRRDWRPTPAKSEVVRGVHRADIQKWSAVQPWLHPPDHESLLKGQSPHSFTPATLTLAYRAKMTRGRQRTRKPSTTSSPISPSRHSWRGERVDGDMRDRYVSDS